MMAIRKSCRFHQVSHFASSPRLYLPRPCLQERRAAIFNEAGDGSLLTSLQVYFHEVSAIWRGVQYDLKTAMMPIRCPLRLVL